MSSGSLCLYVCFTAGNIRGLKFRRTWDSSPMPQIRSLIFFADWLVVFRNYVKIVLKFFLRGKWFNRTCSKYQQLIIFFLQKYLWIEGIWSIMINIFNIYFLLKQVVNQIIFRFSVHREAIAVVDQAQVYKAKISR